MVKKIACGTHCHMILEAKTTAVLKNKLDIYMENKHIQHCKSKYVFKEFRNPHTLGHTINQPLTILG